MTQHEAPDDCTGCEALGDRRAFLRDMGRLALGALVAAGMTPSVARALPLEFVSGRREGGARNEHAYPIPAADGVQIDKDESVIIARSAGVAYAFGLACPHQNTALRWDASESRFQCPKHKSRYRMDGEFIEGRATRSMDRYAIRRDGANLVVDVDKLLREDDDAAEWKAALVRL
ncbi:MAG: Rieske [2Fe-2S] iron-sulfur protein [Gemmatimonadetes bacterium]|nr:Rieske [2Fe-2S] iron-sulfur protein [Gemmatimonadota bacterium]